MSIYRKSCGHSTICAGKMNFDYFVYRTCHLFNKALYCEKEWSITQEWCLEVESLIKELEKIEGIDSVSKPWFGTNFRGINIFEPLHVARTCHHVIVFKR
ncbi:hypothetical protein PIB30_024005 [Stylosanthes scabra]|uniref:Uncharacterized protein n=1 Tax=Stylosanthes scabra TaxID=79078 RepID=A0ABU6Z6D2_9FABA|nr:hypothetical protein [Stylosanthes scabra]